MEKKIKNKKKENNPGLKWLVFKISILMWGWWYTHVILIFERLRQGKSAISGSLGHVVRRCQAHSKR